MKAAQSNLRFIALLGLALVLAGCKPYLQAVQTNADASYEVKEGSSIGQSFTAGYAGLEGIQLFLEPAEPGTGDITLHLRSSSDDTNDLALSTMPVELVTEGRYYNFNFPPQSNSERRYYYTFLEIQGEGEVRLQGTVGQRYHEGAMYLNHTPIDAQASFRLSYDRWRLSAGLLQMGAGWIGIIFSGVLLFIIPGMAALTWAWRESGHLSLAERLGLGAGLSLVMYPLLMLWTNLVGIRLGWLYAWLPVGVGLSFFIWRRYLLLREGNFEILSRMKTRRPVVQPSDAALLLLMAMLVLSRFWVIRTLDAPMWGDSYQHSLIAQLLVDNKGLFSSWLPYADLNTFTYHFGFHSQTAALHWLTNLPMPEATLWMGQLLNILAVLTLYPLAVKIGKTPWAGVMAVLVAGLMAPMPMAYVNWGRYTQLAGQVILPVAIYLSWTAIKSDAFSRRLAGLAIISMAGLALTHYRVLIIGVLFFAALLLIELVRKQFFLRNLGRVAITGASAVLLFMPWGIHQYGGRIMNIFAQQISSQPQAAGVTEYNEIGSIFSYLPATIWILFLVSIGWFLWRRNIEATVISLWGVLVLLAANPQWLNLPGAGTISSFTVFIAAYIPAGIMAGAASGKVIAWLENRFQTREPGFGLYNNVPKYAALTSLFLLIIFTGMQGVRDRVNDVSISEHALVTRPDIRAAEWIKKNLPEDSRFLVNSFFAFSNSVVVGSDAGWWLPLLAERQTTLPPLNYGLENDPWTGYRFWINSLTSEIQNKGVQHPDVLASLREREITHVYVGQQQGRVNSSGPSILGLEALLNSPNFQVVYHQDRVWIFEVVP